MDFSSSDVPVRRATSYDVARLAGVSQSAVSRTFREGAPVSAETRAKVMRAAESLGYAPSNIARSLITRQSRLVGVLMTELTTRNYPDVIFHLGQVVQASGNRMLVVTLPTDEVPASVVQDLLGYHVDGIVSATSMDDDVLETCRRHRLPIVFYNRVPRGPFASAVGCDHATGMADLIDHLSLAPRERIAFLAGPPGAVVSQDRLAGARQALQRHGRTIDRLAHADFSYDGGRAMAAELFAGKARPTTVLCANDAMALGLLDGCRHDLGLRVPDDVQITGFDDLPQAAWPSHDLTTVRQAVETMTRAAMRMLDEHIAGVAIGSERRLMPAALRIRGSTRPILPAAHR